MTVQPSSCAKLITRSMYSAISLVVRRVGEIRDLVAIIYDQSDRLVVVFIHLKMHSLMGGTGKRATGRSQRKIHGFHRHHLLGVKPAIDPVRPMLHQLGARANQRQWSVPLVDSLHRRTFEMR